MIPAPRTAVELLEGGPNDGEEQRAECAGTDTSRLEPATGEAGRQVRKDVEAVG